MSRNTFQGRLALPQNGATPPHLHLVSHRHICAIPDSTTSRAIIVRYPIYQGQISAQGILHLRNPNLGPNSAKRILDARISDPNSWVEFFGPIFSRKRGPLKNSPSRNAPPKIHLPKFNPETGPKNSHCTSAGPLG